MILQSEKWNFCSVEGQMEPFLLDCSALAAFPKAKSWSKKTLAGIILIINNDLKYHSSANVCKLALKSNQEDSKYSRCHCARVCWTLKCFWHPRLWRVVKHVAIFCLLPTALRSVPSLHFSAGKSASLKLPSQTISARYPPGQTTFYSIYL